MNYYKPAGTNTKVDFIKALNWIKMRHSILFKKISNLEVEYGGMGHLFDQETVMGLVISAVPPEYHTLIALEREESYHVGFEDCINGILEGVHHLLGLMCH